MAVHHYTSSNLSLVATTAVPARVCSLLQNPAPHLVNASSNETSSEEIGCSLRETTVLTTDVLCLVTPHTRIVAVCFRQRTDDFSDLNDTALLVEHRCLMLCSGPSQRGLHWGINPT